MIKRFLITLFLFAGIFARVSAQDAGKLKGFKSSSYDGKSLLVIASNGYITITPFTPEIIRVTYNGNTQEIPKSYSTVAKPGKVKVKYVHNKLVTALQTSLLKITVNKKDLSVSFINLENETLSQTLNYSKSGDSSAIDFMSDGTEAFYGGGSKAINLNRRGHVLQNYNQAHWDYEFGQPDLNIAIPFLLSNRGYGLYLDNAAKSSFDVGKTNPKILGYKTTSGPVTFFFMGGENLAKLVNNYTFLTGRQPLPPRWALGYISSRYGYKSEREVRNVIDSTQKKGIPLDAVVFDLFWYKADSLMGNQNWYRDSFPDPRKMLHNFLTKGIKVVTISETYITEKSENFAAAKQQHLLTPDFTNLASPHIFKDFWAGPAALLDIFKPAAQQFYWQFYKARITEGTAGWWFDLGEPESSSDSLRFYAGADNKVHNLYPLIWSMMAYDGYRRDFPGQRPFILPRSGYAGMQRYSTFPWSGDIDRSFDGLKAQIPIITSMGPVGVGYMHSDAGGFTGAGHAKKDTELYARWLEFAAFTPVMRTHADATNYSPEPIFWDDVTRMRVTKYIKLRYQLLPYNYTLAYLNTTTGLPLVMPLDFFDTGNSRLADINDEYLWGKHILVAPVIVKGQTVKKVIFPKGEWIGFNDLKTYKDSASVSAPLDSLPLFVKAGSIIPMLAPITNTSQYYGDQLTLRYYLGDSTAPVKSQWFYDDGKDPNSLSNRKYDLVNFTSSGSGNQHYITIRPVHLTPKKRIFSLIVEGRKVESVTFSGKTKYRVSGSKIYFDWDGKPLRISIKTLK